MATKEKDDVSAPIAVLLMFLAFALAAGGLGNLDGGGGDSNGGQAASEDPCEDQPMDYVVADWPRGRVPSSCGAETAMRDGSTCGSGGMEMG